MRDLTVLACVGLLAAGGAGLSAGVAFGQGAVTLSVGQVTPPPAPTMVGGYMGSSGIVGFTRGFVGGEVKGQPYSLVEKTATVRVLADGTTITNVREEHRMRDSEGRQRTELSQIKDGVSHIEMVTIFDPVARTTTMLMEQVKQARVTHMPESKPPTPEQEARFAEMRQKAAAARAAQDQAIGTTPQPKRQSASSTVEKLDPRNIAGLYAEGRRIVNVIPAGQQGNDREMRVVTEQWKSPDLGIELARTRDDPRMGKMTMEVTELQRVEPDPALFQIPAGYKVIEPKRLGETAE